MSESRRLNRLDYATADRRRPRRWHFALIVLGALSVAAMGWYLVAVKRSSLSARIESPRVQCSSRLKALGMGLLLYANDFGGRYPDTLSELVAGDYTEARSYICPASSDTPAATGPTTRATIANIDSGGHLSYVYLGKGQTNLCGPNYILAYEPLANHANAGMNVLYGDSRVEWLPMGDAARMLGEIGAGYNPPRDPATQPTGDD